MNIMNFNRQQMQFYPDDPRPIGIDIYNDAIEELDIGYLTPDGWVLEENIAAYIDELIGEARPITREDLGG